LNETALVGEDDGLGAVVKVELLEDSGDMGLDGGLAEHELAGDLPLDSGPILVAILCVFELQSYPTWDRNGVADWITQSAFAVGSAVCLIVAFAVLKRLVVERRAAKRAGVVTQPSG
jgi:hypothetical protein